MKTRLFINITFLLVLKDISLCSEILAVWNHEQMRAAVDTASTAIRAEEGFEWQNGAGRFVARGNVRVHRRHVMLNTDMLTVSSHRVPFHDMKGPAEPFWWRAIGNTRLVFSGGTFSGETADYDVHDKILSLRGRPIYIETATGTLTAYTSINYNKDLDTAKARGNIHIVTKNGLVLLIKVASVYLQQSGQSALQEILLIGDQITLKTYREIVCGKRGLYGLDTGIAIMRNAVQMATHSMKMTGERTVMSTKTGLSRFYTDLGKEKKHVGLEKHKKGERIRKRVKLLLLKNLKIT